MPSFDHKVGDPIEDDIEISACHELVFLEGNYVFLDEAVWRDIGQACDERWLITVDLDSAMERVVRRHRGTGLSLGAARARVDGNDRPNGEDIFARSRAAATRLVPSVDDPEISGPT